MDLTILIIDDNFDDRFMIKRAIKKPEKNITILEADTGEEALEIINNNNTINFIFLDYMLPDTDGISLLKQIYDPKSDLGPCPVVMMTGQGSESVAIDAIRYGAQDYIMKDNISTDTLYIAIAKAREVFDLKHAHNEAKAFLEHSQKMDAVGKLTGGIAHDFNNLLTIIFGNTRLLNTLLQQENVDADTCLEKVSVIQKTSKRGADLVKRLMVFSRQRTLDPTAVSLNDLITNLIELLGRTLGDFVDIETDLERDVPNIHIDPGQLENAIINIGVNARDAMHNGGTLSIKTKRVFVNDDKAAILEIEAGECVCLTLADTGSGIPADLLEKIFDPFFTTKDVGEGTGLGLSMVYGLVKESGGGLEVESQSGEGTAFHLYFPQLDTQATVLGQVQAIEEDIEASSAVSAKAPDAGATHPDGNQAEGDAATILLVEDEDDIRFLTACLLREYGYNVLEAANGVDALDIIQAKGDLINLVFTDISMPGELNGVQMAARAEAIKPGVKLLFTTGYAGNAAPDMHLIADYPILHKPYAPEDLMQKLHLLLHDKT